MRSARTRRLALLSWWMLPAFVAWSAIYILLSEPILRLVFGFTPSQPGDSFYVEAWGPWIVLALLWLAPLLAGLVLAVIAVKRRAGKSAWWAIAVHGLLLLSFTVPNIIERFLTL